MKKTRFTEEQIAYAIRQNEGGEKTRDICRKLGISEQTFYACSASTVESGCRS
jgi:putative transposase